MHATGSRWRAIKTRALHRERGAGETPLWARALLATTAAFLVSLPASADIEYVTPSQATAAARELPRQAVNAGRVWLILGGGSLALFALTLAAENNAAWFPAIARANQAMRKTRDPVAEAPAPAEEASQETVDSQRLAAARQEAELQASVLAGLSEARSKVLPDSPSAARAVERGADGADTTGAERGSAGAREDGDAPAAETRAPMFELTAEDIERSAREAETAQAKGEVAQEAAGSESAATEAASESGEGNEGSMPEAVSAPAKGSRATGRKEGGGESEEGSATGAATGTRRKKRS